MAAADAGRGSVSTARGGIATAGTSYDVGAAGVAATAAATGLLVAAASCGPATAAAADVVSFPLPFACFNIAAVALLASVVATASSFRQQVVAAPYADYCYCPLPMLKEMQYGRSQIPTGMQT